MTLPDFARLSKLWQAWGPAVGGDPISVSTTTPGYEVCFESSDWSARLRVEGSWWVMDTVDDRNQLRTSAGRFSSFPLLEKYLLWEWATTAISSLASGRLGADLARQGFSPEVTVTRVDGGHQICTGDDCAVLTFVRATVFSHLIARSFEEIASMVNAG